MGTLKNVGKAIGITVVVCGVLYGVVGAIYSVNAGNADINLEIKYDGKTAVYQKKSPYTLAIPFFGRQRNGYETLTIDNNRIDLLKEENSALKEKVAAIYSGIESIINDSGK